VLGPCVGHFTLHLPQALTFVAHVQTRLQTYKTYGLWTRWLNLAIRHTNDSSRVNGFLGGRIQHLWTIVAPVPYGRLSWRHLHAGGIVGVKEIERRSRIAALEIRSGPPCNRGWNGEPDRRGKTTVTWCDSQRDCTRRRGK
jgi:hypothetical protein